MTLLLILIIVVYAIEIIYKPRFDTTDYNDLLIWYNGKLGKREHIKLL